MNRRGEVLVAIMNHPLDLNVALDQHWYRIPIRSAEKWLRDCWPPEWLAFYQTKVFGPDAYSVTYFGRVVESRQVYRWELFPDQPPDEKSEQRYHQVFLGPLQRLASPIRSRRWRRIVFIPTTWRKLIAATEVNDLYDESPLEDLLWDALKQIHIGAERQEFVEVGGRSYSLDFAVYCAKGSLDIETDGDGWHANPDRAAEDNLRDNDLESVGWQQLRFSSRQIREEMAAYCVPKIVKTVNRMGGLDEGSLLPRKVGQDGPEGEHQLGLFDEA